MTRIVWVLFSSLCVYSVNVQALTLQTLHSQLSHSKATWKAGHTKVSALSRDEQKRLLGANIEDTTDYFMPHGPQPRTYAPSKFSWRDSGEASPILDQGRCGSCVAFASIGMLETQMNITRKTTTSPWAFSPQHLFACGGGGCETGWTPFGALNFLESDGVPDEACFPYESGATGKDMACSSSCSDAASRSQKIARSITAAFFFSSVASLKKAIAKGPLLTTLKIYEDFMFYKGGVYKHSSGDELGGHAVVIEGWDDADKAWIVRNSWGEDWGEKGYFRIAWDDDCGVGRMAWGVEVSPSSDGMVSLGNLRDNAVLSTDAQMIHVESTFSDTRSVSWEMKQAGKPVATGVPTRAGGMTMDTTKMADGTYTLAAVAERAGSLVRSQPRNVHVLNGSLSGSLAITNVKDGDELSGKKILECDLSSKPIPFQQVAFRAKNLSTGEVVLRRTQNIASRIDLSFFTPKVDNGDWELTLEGTAGTQSVMSKPVKVTIKN